MLNTRILPTTEYGKNIKLCTTCAKILNKTGEYIVKFENKFQLILKKCEFCYGDFGFDHTFQKKVRHD